MKLLILYTRLSGYTAACLRAFRGISDSELLIYAWPNQENSPFDNATFRNIGDVHSRTEHSVSDIELMLTKFKPDAVLVSGWADAGYIKICRKLKAQGTPVISGCDTQWIGSLRQRLAGIFAHWHVQKFIDILWVSGERQRQLATKLGYCGKRCWDGYYACDWDTFAYPKGEKELAASPKFLFVGRYAPEKGLDILAKAYQIYCKKVANPWPLICVGAGPLQNLLIKAGAEDRGFIQPADLPALMHEAAAFILPSQFEPWGVVAQEAAASHLPLILSNACGSGVHLLRSHLNGFTFKTGSVSDLTRTLISMHLLKPEQRNDYAEASFQLSKQYTPQRWANILQYGIKTL